jgi:CubicO group peptidase (beta-lactamase class C family)
MNIARKVPSEFKSLNDALESYINLKKTGCVLSAIYHKEELIYCNKIGWKDIENQIPVEFDDIFRIYSMTKPITCVGALILYEQGFFQLDDPLHLYLPEFSNSTVLKSYNEETNEIVVEKARNPINIKHLFTHTSGLSYGDYPNVYPLDILYGNEFGFCRENRLKDKLEKFPLMPSLEEFSKRLGSLPLLYHPGFNYEYAFSHEILGRLIEVLSGKSLDLFLKEEIFTKLGMQDTDFYVPTEKRNRLTKVYSQIDGRLEELKGPIFDGFYHKIKYLSGGGGLVSTLGDYLRFCIMMLNGGLYEDQRIITEETIELMTSNQLPDGRSYLEMQYHPFQDLDVIKKNEGYGFGLGVQVKIAENITRNEIGSFGWGGALNTLFDVDPKNNLISIIMTQHCPATNEWIQPVDWLLFNKLVYEIIEKL